VITAKSFHENAGVCQECFFCSLVLVRHFALSQAASVAILPSALFMSDLEKAGVDSEQSGKRT
jgi:hypothetical protein